MKINNNLISNNFYKIAIFAIFIFGLSLRFYNLNWDQGQFLHPDERLYINAANLFLPHSFKELLSPSSPLNPHMFYYGSFPLYLYKFVANIFFSSFDLLLVSRMISALFSSLSIIILYLITKKYFSERVALISAFIFAVAPGNIQYAHFNTTESLLIFLMLCILYGSILLYKDRKLHFGFYLGILLGLAYATKIVGLTFLVFPLIVYFFLFFEEKKGRINIVISFLLFLFTAILFGILMAPYQIIDWTHFSQEQSYMQGVTYGKFKPPFVIIYEGTFPYIYPLVKVFPFTFGLVALLSSIGGIYILIKNEKRTSALLLLTIFPLLYFLWTGMWYAKFARYYLPLVPFLSLYAGIFLNQLRQISKVLLLSLILIQGILFFHMYLYPNTRIAATNWIYENIKERSTIATEYWDDALPLQLNGFSGNKSLTNTLLTVYDVENKEKIEKLAQVISKSDYIILSSRRVYVSILTNESSYPYTSKFYRDLFAEKLGFSKMKTFTMYPYIISDDYADESFQSYDHPPVVIFKKNQKLTPSQIVTQLIQ